MYLRKPFVAAALAALLTFALGACSASPTPAASATTQPTTAAATSAPAAATAAPTSAPTTAAASQPAAAPTEAAPAAAATAAPIEAAPAAVATSKLNLNTLTEEQLLSTIPDFSGRMVREFFEYRPYISIQQFRQEIGKYVSAEQVAAYEQYVYVPIAVDVADAATLQQLPGVNASAAQALIDGRPYGGNAAFLEALSGYVSADDAAAAAAYLDSE